jgi:excisionase family DNA binding protein
LNYAEAAELLGMRIGTLYALVSRQRIPHVRLSRRMVRFPERELRRWMNSHLVQPCVGGDLEVEP